MNASNYSLLLLFLMRPQVLLMLSESGVLFLSEFTPLGRRWVRPLRLPESRPLELLLNGVLIASLIACR